MINTSYLVCPLQLSLIHFGEYKCSQTGDSKSFILFWYSSKIAPPHNYCLALKCSIQSVYLFHHSSFVPPLCTNLVSVRIL